MKKQQFVIQGSLVISFVVLIIGALVANEIHNVPVSKPDIIDLHHKRSMFVSGMVITQNSITLDFNPCDLEMGDEDASSLLYSKSGVSFHDLVPGVSRDVSIAQFSYLNLHIEGSEIIGDIGSVSRKGAYSRGLLWIACGFQLVNFLLLVSQFMFGGNFVSFPVMLVSSVVFAWVSLINSTSTIPILLAHLFREAIYRCEIEPSLNASTHWELLNLSNFVASHSKIPNGTSIILVSVAICLALAYVAAHAAFSAMRSVRLTYLVRFRALHWYARIWPIYVTLTVFLLSILSVYFVAMDDRTRGYPLNLFYWNFSGKRKSGLSSTGSLLDLVQDFFQVVTIPPNMMRASVYVWLGLVPLVAAASIYPLATLFKSIQDVSVLLLTRSLVAWVTVAPSPISMLEKPDCFQTPNATLVTCNDSMFSVHAIAVVVPAMISLFFLKFTAILHAKYNWLANVLVTIAVCFSLLFVVIARYQYTADVSIGAFVCVMYMFTQQGAYELFFNKESNSKVSTNAILQDNVVPALDECVRRITEYNLATQTDVYSRISNEELEEIKFLYRNVGDAIGRARTTRSIASSPAAIGTPIQAKKDQ